MRRHRHDVVLTFPVPIWIHLLVHNVIIDNELDSKHVRLRVIRRYEHPLVTLPPLPPPPAPHDFLPHTRTQLAIQLHMHV